MVLKEASDSIETILKEKYGTILKKNKIVDEILKVDIDENPDLPVHFTSNCKFITIHFSSGQLPPLELFVKTLKFNAEIKDEEEFSLFDKESNLYLMVLPELRDVCIRKTKSEQLVDLFPKVYHAEENEIVMENLMKQNFIMLDSESRHSFHESSIVMKHLARFHSVSYALIKKLGLQNFQKRFPYTRERMMKRNGVGYDINTMMIDSTITKLTSLLKESMLPNSEFAYGKLSKYQTNAFSTMCDVVESKQLFHVLNHGDVWLNNMLFQKDENENLAHLRFVDLQMTRVGSPNLDISYYFYNSLQPKIRETQLRTLLEIYYVEFVENVKSLESEFTYTFEEFLQDHGKIGKLGLLYGVYIAAASPLMGKVDLEGSKNWIEDFVTEIRLWLDNNPHERKEVLREVISMVETFCHFGEL